MNIDITIKKCKCGSDDFHFSINDNNSEIRCNNCGESFVLYESSLPKLVELWNSYIGKKYEENS